MRADRDEMVEFTSAGNSPSIPVDTNSSESNADFGRHKDNPAGS